MAQVMKQTLKAYNVPNFSIFSPEPLDKSDEFEEEEKVDYSERSPSPLEEVIRVPPILYEDFLNILRNRIKPDPNFTKLTVEHQEGLVSILFCEVHSHWEALCESIVDPALDTYQNRKVHVLLFIEVVKICQYLFTSYLNKVDKLNAKGVFSKKANISRIKGALISEANQSLNIHKLRQKILRQFKNKHSATLSSKIASKPNTAIPAEEFASFFDKELAKKIHPVTPIKPVVLGDRSKPTSMPHLVASLMDLNKQPPEEPKKKMTLPMVVEELIIATHAEQVEPVGSVEFRHKDLEFLMSDQRQTLTAAIDDEEELSALLQATTKCTIVKRPPRTSRCSISEMSDTIDTSDKPIQPAVTSYDMPDKTIVRTSDIRVSERVPLSDMILELSPCIYNELNNDITESDITFLDRNLFLGQEIREVYSEIYKTITHDHLKFSSTMEAPCKTLPAQSCYNSGVLKREKYKHKRINEKLKVTETAPWSDAVQARSEWEGPVHFQGEHSQHNSEVFPSQIIKFPQFSDFDTNNFGPSGKDPHRQLSKEGRSYTNWLQWWKSIMSCEDYQRYTSIRDSDFLALIFHLYDSEEEVDSADERDALLECEMKKEKERRNQKLEKMMEAKNKYEGGFWNANSILMGGLGKHPDIDDQDGTTLSLEQSRSIPIPKIEMKLSRLTSAGSSSTRRSGISKKTKKSSTLLENPEEEEPPQTVEIRILQDRLENIWDSLEMPDDRKIDMTVKYCNLDVKKLKKVVDLWDAACSSVISREKLILELEGFEKSASDPKRFFTSNTPMTRIKEEKQRSGLHRRIKKCDKEVKTNLMNVKRSLKDTVTYQGRNYLEKMSRDLTEMLYWLQQERRQYALEKGGMVMVDLPPISPVDLIG